MTRSGPLGADPRADFGPRQDNSPDRPRSLVRSAMLPPGNAPARIPKRHEVRPMLE